MTVTASRALGPNPQSFGSMFWENQFKTTIPLPSKDDSLKDQVAIITGSNSGLGLESAKQMLGAGLSRLIMGVRSIERGQEAAAQLRTVSTDAIIDVWQIDMENYQSIQRFVRRCEIDLPRIDFVILNAGIAPAYHAKLATGHESTVQVNYLSTVLLSILLLPVLKAKRPPGPEAQAPRLITLGSVTARNAKFPNKSQRPLLPSFDQITPALPWDPNDRYAVSKLLCQLTLERIAARYVDARDVVILMLEPGWVRGTGLFRALPAIPRCIVRGLLWVCGRPLEQGAATYFDAAVRQPVGSHGSYVMNCRVAPYADFLYTEEAEGVADALWDETMDDFSFANALEVLESMKKP
ncbi:hypothetical protein PG993_003939 [Apiospora rasikravindrae]|uniref:Uncharacterized protein n=1 Tax=Apiospora rasikravindrae TaxID=990691 RepID=A0ABR1U0X4_9PEZI